VATQLRCGGITNFRQNAPVKNFLESVNIWQRYGQNFVAYFLGAPCRLRYSRERLLRTLISHRCKLS